MSRWQAGLLAGEAVLPKGFGLRPQLVRIFADTNNGTVPSPSALADAMTVLEGVASTMHAGVDREPTRNDAAPDLLRAGQPWRWNQ
ncbi:hypothetical protein GCM10010359_61760 [Streptomyces morookaense]|nr:hypothetical protein GCM10010359_61760 [Streptomyces morookaense]